MLLQCHKELDGNKAVGVDEITKKEYEKNLEQNIDDLVERLKRKSYKPQPSIRPLINDFLRKMAKFRHQENQDVSAGTRIRFFIDKPAAMISFPRAVIKYL